MTDNTPEELSVKEKYENCKGLECPRLLSLTEEREDGTRRIAEGDLAYTAIVLCNNWTIGLSDGDCPVYAVDAVSAEI